MLEKLRKERGDEGFTLIELLVVIIIIGILAAIAIPVFLNQRQKGWEAAVKSDLRNAATAQETYLTESNDLLRRTWPRCRHGIQVLRYQELQRCATSARGHHRTRGNSLLPGRPAAGHAVNSSPTPAPTV